MSSRAFEEEAGEPESSAPSSPRAADDTRTHPDQEARPASAKTSAAAELPIVAAGHYQLAHEHARGGLGRVFAARDQVLSRPVAIKELLAPGVESRARFVREALLTARLQHPAIVPIYQAGRWPQGDPFYVMKMVAGRSLKEAIADAGDGRTRLSLLTHVIAVAEAVAYAHNQRIIHRDLKPSNVVLGEFGETVVVDWGIAKDLASQEWEREGEPPLELPPRSGEPTAERSDEATAERSDEATAERSDEAKGETGTGAVLGTPHYMPPEQARGEPVDERADVYSLGAILYQVLSGRAPYQGLSWSAALSAVLAAPPQALAELEPSAPPELVGIVDRAMARAPADRYGSARELALDLRRFQAGQLVGSYRYSAWTLFVRRLRRHRLPVALSLAFITALAAVGALSVARIARERTAAEDRRNHVVLLQARSTLEHDPAATIAWLKSYPIETGDYREVRSIFEEARGRTALAIATGAIEVSAVGGKFRILRSDGTALDYDPRTNRAEVHRVGNIPAHLLCTDISRSGLIAVSDNRAHTIFDPDRGTERTYLLPAGVEQFYGWCTFTRDSHWLGFGVEGGLGWLDVRSGELKILRAPGAAMDFTLSNDEKTLAWSGPPVQAVHVVDFSTGATEEWATPGATPTWIALRSNTVNAAQSGFIIGSNEGRVQIWARPGVLEHDLDACPFAVLDARLLEDQKRLFVSCQDGTIKLIDVQTGSIQILGSNGHGRSGVAYSRGDPNTVFTIGSELATAWNLSTGASASMHYEGTAALGSLSDDGAYFATAPSPLGEVRLFRAPPLAVRAFTGEAGRLSFATFSPDGRRLAYGTHEGFAICDNLGDACRLYPVRAPNFVAWSHDGRRVAYDTDYESGWVDLESGARHAVGTGSASPLVWSPDDGQLAIYDDRHELALAQVADDRVRIIDQGTQALSVSFSPEGRRLMWIHGIDAIEILDLVSGQEQQLSTKRTFARTAFANGGNSVVAAGADGSLSIWDSLEGKPRIIPRWFEQTLEGLAVSPDGRLVATASSDGKVRLLDLTMALTMPGSDPQQSASFSTGAAASTVQFSPDGKSLASGAIDGRVWLYDLATGDLHLMTGHQTAVRALSFAPASDRLLSSSLDREIVWDLTRLPPPLADAASVRAAIDRESSVVLDSRDRPITPLP